MAHMRGKPARLAPLIDLLYLAVPLLVLALIGVRTVAAGTIVYPDPLHLAYETGDYYRYVNMALPNGDSAYIYLSPFLYRLLVPLIVHGAILFGASLDGSFFTITALSCVCSTVGIYGLARGARLSRWEATCTALAYVTLQWAVAYNFRDYFLVDPAAQAFIVGALLAIQRQRWLIAAIIMTIGAIGKESIYLAVAVAVVQLLHPYLAQHAGNQSDVGAQLAARLRRVPRATWYRVAGVVGGPVLATGALHLALHPVAAISTLHVWKHYLPEHFAGGFLHGLYTTVAQSTWGTYGVLFVLALGAVPLRIWARSRFSLWAIGVALLIVLYSYAVSGDSQRLSITGWPFVVLLAAITVHELGQRLRVAAAWLWVPVLLADALFQPTAGPPGPVILGSQAMPVAQHLGPPVMAIVSLVYGALIIVAMTRGSGATRADINDDDDQLAETVKRPRLGAAIRHVV